VCLLALLGVVVVLVVLLLRLRRLLFLAPPPPPPRRGAGSPGRRRRVLIVRLQSVVCRPCGSKPQDQRYPAVPNEASTVANLVRVVSLPVPALSPVPQPAGSLASTKTAATAWLGSTTRYAQSHRANSWPVAPACGSRSCRRQPLRGLAAAAAIPRSQYPTDTPAHLLSPPPPVRRSGRTRSV
jgi:hypothetical protein